MWTPSFGLLQLAAYLEREGVEVQIIDGTALRNPWKDLANSVSTSKADVIGITCSATCLSPEAIQTIHLCRKTFTGFHDRGRRKPLHINGGTNPSGAEGTGLHRLR